MRCFKGKQPTELNDFIVLISSLHSYLVSKQTSQVLTRVNSGRFPQMFGFL
jgi:hypothetical protein